MAYGRVELLDIGDGPVAPRPAPRPSLHLRPFVAALGALVLTAGMSTLAVRLDRAERSDRVGPVSVARLQAAVRRTVNRGSMRFSLLFNSADNDVLPPGIIGSVDVGRKVARYAQAFGFNTTPEVLVVDGIEFTPITLVERLSAQLPRTAHWIAQPGASLDFVLNGAGQLTLAELLQVPGAHAERVGPDVVRDVPTTRYLVRADADAGNELEVQLDHDSLVRRLRVLQAGDRRFTLELYDFGIDVRAERPPGAEVISRDDFRRALDKSRVRRA